MKQKVNFMMMILAVLTFSTLALAVPTTVPLNTGYDHSLLVLDKYPTVTSNPSTVRDDYWINVASFPANLGSAFVVPRSLTFWAVPFPNTNWISAWNTNTSPSGSTTTTPAYALFKKCFCLQKGFKEAKVDFQIRGDDYIQIWLNGVSNQILPYSVGNWDTNRNPLSVKSDKGFRVGKNCIYVLVKDTGIEVTGFNLLGTVSAYGLMPAIAKGRESSFAPCACDDPKPIDEGKIVQEILKSANL